MKESIAVPKPYSLHLVLGEALLRTIIELGRARALVRRHFLRGLSCAAVGEIGGNAGGAKRVATEFGRDAGRLGATADHAPGVGHRPGQQHLARFLVRGDLVILAEGDRVPADATVLSAHDLQCDESLLSWARPPQSARSRPQSTTSTARVDDLPYVYSGSLVVRGHGRAEVTATGPRSEIGKIGLAITRMDTEPPRLRVQTTGCFFGNRALGLLQTVLRHRRSALRDNRGDALPLSARAVSEDLAI